MTTDLTLVRHSSGRQNDRNRFLRSARILTSTGFNYVFQSGPFFSTEKFVVYCRFSGVKARIGLVIGKKQARRAVTRNTLKRLARELFRCNQEKFFGYDMIVRLRCKVPKSFFSSATSRELKSVYRRELEDLFQRFEHML